MVNITGVGCRGRGTLDEPKLASDTITVLATVPVETSGSVTCFEPVGITKYIAVCPLVNRSRGSAWLAAPLVLCVLGNTFQVNSPQIGCVYAAASCAVTAILVAAGCTVAGRPVMLICGTAGNPTPTEQGAVMVLLCESVTATRKASPPSAVGVPESVPSLADCSPFGR